ncbi:bacteriocin [Streptococcus ratti]|uniref:Bacteriocin n=1 Tax=Streptococcus ratti TaxID=1341 RepID=A0A7X9LCS1_STRRT|nr:bacteriocin [Streptococcus ratti]NMD48855.1 bacteriocin [Streptococcus ratti]
MMESNTTFNYVDLTDEELQAISGGGASLKGIVLAYQVGHMAGETVYNILH